MFKKLKDKIAEEVKQSPLKSVQQLAQAVVSPSSSSVFEPSSSNDKFCIEEGDIEEDEKQEQEKPGGFTSVTLTGQTTSPIREQTQKYGFRSSSGSLKSEADNLFPKFEPQPTNFHVQSDWESASEVEDRGSQLEHISKESLYEAYRKIYNRYNRTKNKYHEIVTHYRQLEREKEKAKTVLTETQDKALMRISELREQCLLEQQAKAHLEEALRNELEERDHIINTLRTKVQYLKGIGDISATESLDASFLSKEEENLIDFTENSSVSSVPLPFDASSNKEKIEWFEEKIMTLRNVLHEETSKIECLKSKLKVAREQCDHEDVNMKSSDDQHSFVTEHSEKELNQTISNLLSKIATEVQNLQKTAVHCSLLNTVNDKSNLEEKHYVNEKMPIVKNVHDEQSEIMKYTSKIKELEDKNKALIQKLSEESISAKELKNEFNTLSNTADILKKKIKLSNENFGKNDAINCLITDMENELIHEWNLCFQNFLQTRCEITVLKDTKGDLEKELFRIKEEKNKLENMNKEILEMNSKLKGDVEILQKDLKVHSTQIDNLNRERSDFKVRNENLGKKVKELEETLKLNEKVFGERQGDVQKILDEKKTTDNILSSLELELQNIRSEYSHISKAKEELDKEVLSLRKENNELMSEKEELNHKVNELENKFKIVEDDHKTLINTKDDLNNQLNSLSKDMEELTTERNTLLSRISNLDKDVENKELQLSLLVEGKNQLLNEIKTTKDESEIINREKLSLAEKINDLKDEFEKNKLNYSKLLETVQCHSDEICSLKKERDELIQGKSNLESKIADLNVEINAIEANCSENVEIKDRLSIELSCVREERDKLKSEIQLVQNRISDLNTNSKIMNEELSSLRKENAELMTEKSNMQEEIQRLEECLKTNNDNNSTFSEVNIKLTDELDSLKKEINDLVKEKSEIVSESKKLEDQLLISKEEFSKCSSEYNTLSEKLHILQAECHDLAVKYQTERDTTEQINKQLKEKEEELISVNEKNQNLSNEIEKLKNDYDQTDEEFKLLQAQYNNMVTEHEKHKELSISLLKIKNQLTNEVDSLKKDCDKALHTLNQTQSELQKEQDCSSELKKQVSYLSETLKKKCDETNEKYHENTSLRTEIDELLKKITVLNSCTEKLTKDKHSLLNHSLANVHSLKMIRELLTNLYDFVKEFQVEISHELSNINKKLQKDFLESRIDYHDSEKLNKKTVALECKSKQDIDSYNAKLKTQEGSLNILKEISQVEATDLEDSFPVLNEPNMVAFRRMGHLEKSSELDNCISNVQNTCDPEAYLKKAISLMKSFTNLLNHNSVLNDYPDVDIFTPNNEKCIRLNEIEGKNIQKEIIAMESFITEFEAEYNKSDPQRISSKNSKDSDDNVIEMELRQEIKLKDDIIEKLQSVIEDYEQQKGGDDSAFLYSQKVHILEQENKSLSQKLQQVKETHELNVKNLISEYEKKLEEIEDEKHLYDFEKIGKEKTHVVNEMKEQIQNLQEDLVERGDAFEKLYEEHQQSVKSLDTEIHQLRSNHDKELREQDKKWRQCLDRRLAEEETRHRQELTALNTQWNAERRELETARRLAVNAVESGSGSNELLRRQVQALTVQLTEMRNNRCEACDRKRRSDAKELNPRSIQDCTEMEYLRNILYEYMMGKEPLVLAKVLCALVKFDENQTREIVSKEEHKITLFGQLGRL